MDYITLKQGGNFVVEVTGNEDVYNSFMGIFHCNEKKQIPGYGIDVNNNDYLTTIKVACRVNQHSGAVEEILLLRPTKFALIDAYRWIREIRGLPEFAQISEQAWEQIFTATTDTDLVF